MSNVPTNLIPSTITQLPEYGGSSTLGYFPYSVNGRTYKVQFSNLAAVGAVPSSRVIAAGTGLAGGGDLSENRVISIANGGVGFDQLSATGVSAGSYGSGGDVPVITVDAKGRVTDISTTPLVVTGYVPDSRTITTGAGLLGGGSLASNRTLSVDFYASAPQALGSASPGVSNAAARGDHVHPAVNLSDTTQTQGALPLGRGGTGDALSPVAGAVVYSTGTKLALADPGDPGQVLTSAGTGEPYWSTIAGTGTVTSVSVLTANGFSGTVAFANTTPQITISTTVSGLLKGDGVAMTAAEPGVDYALPGANTDITSLSGITGGIATPDYIDFDTTAAPARATGRLWWDNADGIQTLNLGMAGSNATLQIGEEMYFRIKASSAITEGQVVMFTGTVGNSGALTGAPATGLTKDTASYVMGVATEDIALNGWGYVTQFGLVRSINTTGGAEAWVDGQILYYDPAVAGGLTKNVPSAPAAKVEVAAVVKAASNGSLFVRPIARFSLGQLNDVETAAAANGDLLQYNSSGGGYWQHVVPSTISVGTATNLAGGAANRIAYQTGAGATSFISAPVTPNTFLEWSGSGFQWSVNPLGTVTSVGMSVPTGLTVTGSPITTSGTLAVGLQTGYSIPTNASQANWDAAYSDRLQWDGGSTNLVAATGRTSLGLGTAAVLNAGAANGVATLDSAGTVPTSQLPAAVLGALNYQGAWNASTNTPTLASGVGTKGYFYVVDVAGSTNLDGITDWKVGDWAVFSGSVWQKIDNTESVVSVNGYTGVVNLTYTDVGAPSTSGTGATGTWGINVTGNAGTVTNGVYTTGSYTDPTWLVSLAASKLTGTVAVANGGTGSSTAAGARTSLGGTTVGSNFFTLTNPNAISFPQINADNTVSALSAAAFRAAIGAGTGGGSVTSVDVSGGTTGLTTSGGPITSSGTITLAGTLNVANGGTGATALSSGYLVKGNGTSAVSASVVYDDGTNVGIGTSSPGSKLSVAGGNIQVESTYGLVLSGATSNGYFVDDGSVGGKIQTGGGFRVFTGGANERVRITSTGDVGIGTTSPAGRLDVTATSAGGTTYSYFQNNGASGVSSVGLAFAQSSAIKSSIVAAVYGNDYMTFNVGSNTERMRIDASGNVLIGTTTAVDNNFPLELNAGASGLRGMGINNNGGYGVYLTYDNTGRYSTNGAAVRNIANSPLYFETNNTLRATLDASGNLGLGVTPSAWSATARAFEFGPYGALYQNASGYPELAFNTYVNTSNNYTYRNTDVASRYLQYNGQHQWYTAPSGTAGAAISFTQAMTLDASGRLGVGVTPATNRLVMARGQYLAWQNTGTLAEASGITADTSDNMIFFNNGSERMRITSQGDVAIGTTSGGTGLFVVPRANVPYTIFNTASAGYGYSSYQYAGSAYGYLGQASAMIGGASNTDFAIRSENNMLFAIGGTERARIDSSGRLLVGVSSASPNTPAGSIQYVAGAQLTSGNFGRIWVPGQSIGSATYAGLYGMASTYNAYYDAGWKSIGGGTASAITIDEGIFSFSNSNSVGSAGAALTWNTRLTINTSGSVGIGTSSPNTKLQVYGNTGNNPTIINVQHDVSGNNFDYASVSASSNTGSVGITSWGTGSVRASTGWVQTVGAIPLVVGVNDTEVARFATSGNVGIGTSTTTYKLNVAGDLYLAGGGDLRLSSASGGNDTSLYNDAQDLFFVVNGSTRMYVNSSGNVGIGTSSPSQKLTLQGAQLIIPAAGWSSGQTAYLYLGDTNNGISSTNGSYTTYLSFNGHNWLINGTEAMRIDGSRNVGIGTTSVGSRLNVKGGMTWIQNFNGSASSPTEAIDWPVPALNVASFGDFTLQTMMAFTLPNDGNYFTGDTVWNIRLEQTASSITSSSSTGFRLMGPGYLAFGSGQQERLRFSTSGGITSSDLADAVGYKGLPQNQQTTTYTLALSDMGKHVFATAGTFTITIPANASVAFPVGTAITIFCGDATKTLAPAAGVTLIQAGTSNTGNRTLAINALVTLVKLQTNTWVVSGAGLS